MKNQEILSLLLLSARNPIRNPVTGHRTSIKSVDRLYTNV